MTLEHVKALTKYHFTPIDVVVEWYGNEAKMILDGQSTQSLTYDSNRLNIGNESVDKLIIHTRRYSELGPKEVIGEAKRVLKKNGRIFLSFYHSEKVPFLTKIFGMSKGMVWTIDQVADIIRINDLLIEKNILIEEDLIYFEIVKIENERLGQLILT